MVTLYCLDLVANDGRFPTSPASDELALASLVLYKITALAFASQVDITLTRGVQRTARHSPATASGLSSGASGANKPVHGESNLDVSDTKQQRMQTAASLCVYLPLRVMN